jgi:RNA polymerase sigma-70 factor (ECF subfamily)
LTRAALRVTEAAQSGTGPHLLATPLTDHGDDPIAALLARVAAGDRAAFRALYSASSPKLFGVLLRMLGDRGEAEDALQDVYTRAWASAARFDPARGRGMTWLIAIARNRAIDRLRSRPDATAAEPEVLEAVSDPTPGAEARVLARGALQRLDGCFGTLEPDRAAAVRGAYLQGLSYQELAARHAVPLNTMRTWLRRGLIALRECLDR